MEIEVVRTGDVTVAAPTGDLDAVTAETFRGAVAGLIDERPGLVIVDLQRVGHVDSSGLGAIVAVMKHARRAGSDIKLAGLQEDVRLVFDMTRLIKVIETYPTREEAVAACS